MSLNIYKSRYKNIIDKAVQTCISEKSCKRLHDIRFNKIKKFDYRKSIQQNCLSKVYKGAKKGSIVTIGCSYTAGEGLKENQTFAYKLNKETGRTVYNRGICGTGPQMVYRQLSDKNFKNEIPDAQYIIYTFLYNHLDRQFQYSSSLYGGLDISYYINHKNELTERKRPFRLLYFFYTPRIYAEWQDKIAAKNRDKKFELFYRTMEESVKAMKKNYPEAKFILLEIPDALISNNFVKSDYWSLTKEQRKKLEDIGIICINAEETVGHELQNLSKYRLPDKDHPNENLWNEVVPALVKQLDL